jgi:hypothetical protein
MRVDAWWGWHMGLIVSRGAVFFDKFTFSSVCHGFGGKGGGGCRPPRQYQCTVVSCVHALTSIVASQPVHKFDVNSPRGNVVCTLFVSRGPVCPLNLELQPDWLCVLQKPQLCNYGCNQTVYI